MARTSSVGRWESKQSKRRHERRETAHHHRSTTHNLQLLYLVLYILEDNLLKQRNAQQTSALLYCLAPDEKHDGKIIHSSARLDRFLVFLPDAVFRIGTSCALFALIFCNSCDCSITISRWRCSFQTLLLQDARARPTRASHLGRTEDSFRRKSRRPSGRIHRSGTFGRENGSQGLFGMWRGPLQS